MNELKQNQMIAEELKARGQKIYVAYRDGATIKLDFGAGQIAKGFTQSLDSCRTFEETLTDEEWYQYGQLVLLVVETKRGWLPTYDYISILKATPSQRCEAFLRMLEKWESE